jgi:hypothetical protein
MMDVQDQPTERKNTHLKDNLEDKLISVSVGRIRPTVVYSL